MFCLFYSKNDLKFISALMNSQIKKTYKIVTPKKNEKIVIGKSVMIKKPGEYLFITTGIATQIALNASKKLDNEHNIKSGVIHFPSIKPLDSQALLKWVKKVKKIITVEENVLSGGFGKYQ